MAIRVKHIPAVLAVLALAGCGGGGKDRVRDALSDLISSERGDVDSALGIFDALDPPPGGTPPAITLERAADGSVGMTVTRGPGGPQFEVGDGESLDDVWTRTGAVGSRTGSVERVIVYTDIETPGVQVGGMGELQDDDYLYLGWWLSEPEDVQDGYAFRAFAEGTESFTPGDRFTRGHADSLEGEAVYEGLAAGRYVTIDFSGGVPSGAASGAFTATAELTASFGGTSVAVDDHFSIRGSVRDFVDANDGDSLDDWSVELEKTGLAAGSASFSGGDTAATIADSSGTGSWEGAFFGNARADGQPGSVAGTFDAQFTAARISGAFGARNAGDDE